MKKFDFFTNEKRFETRGIWTKGLITPKVLEASKKYYGCESNINGIPLNNIDANMELKRDVEHWN